MIRDYQTEGIEFLAKRKYALLADDPGLGKTLQAIFAAREVDHARVLIVCPSQVKYNWVEEFQKWEFPLEGGAIQVIDKSVDKIHPLSRVVIINYEMLIRPQFQKEVQKFSFDLVICDEAHRLKRASSIRTKKILGAYGILRRTKRMWFLTGTPITSRPIDLFPLVTTCMAEVFKPYHKYLSFAHRYCGAYQGPFGLVVNGATNLDELSQKLSSFMLRRRKRDVLKELPQRIIQRIDFECSAKVRDAIREEEELTQELAGDRDPENYKMGEISRIRRTVAKHKIDDAIKFIKDRLEEDKVVVFFYHKDVCKILQEKLKKYHPLTIDGTVSSKKRTEIVKKFQEEARHQVFLGQMEASGEGIDGLQHVSSTCIFVEPSWLPKDMDQCISRLERMGQKNPVNAYILTIRGTIESKMMGLLEWKLHNINTILKDDQTLKTTKKGEQKMGKVYMEDKVDQLSDQVQKLAETIASLVSVLTPTGTEEVKVKKEEKPVKVKKEEKTEEKQESLIELARHYGAQIIKADPLKGKDVAKSIIAKTGEAKLADLNDEQLQQVVDGFLEVING